MYSVKSRFVSKRNIPTVGDELTAGILYVLKEIVQIMINSVDFERFTRIFAQKWDDFEENSIDLFWMKWMVGERSKR